MLCDVLDCHTSLHLGYNGLLKIFQGFLLKPVGRYFCHKIFASFVSLQYLPVVYFVRNKHGGRGQEEREASQNKACFLVLAYPSPVSVTEQLRCPAKKEECL